MAKAEDRIMPFGKHKGKKLSEIPVGYLDWVLGLDNLNESLRKDIKAYLDTQAEYQGDHWQDREDDLREDVDD